MTPQYEWDDDDTFPKGMDVFVGVNRREGIVHSRSKNTSGTYVYGVRWKGGDKNERMLRYRHPDTVDCYCEAHNMESLLF